MINGNSIFYTIENISKTKSKIVDSSRLFKSIREINEYKELIRINIISVNLKPIHIVLFAKAIKNQSNIQVRIRGCSLSSETLYQFKNLLKIKQVQFDIRCRIKSEFNGLAVINLLRSVSSWGSSITISFSWSNNIIWDFKIDEKTLEKIKLTIYERNSNKIKFQDLKESLKIYNFEYFKSILCIPQKKFSRMDVYLTIYLKKLNDLN